MTAPTPNFTIEDLRESLGIDEAASEDDGYMTISELCEMLGEGRWVVASRLRDAVSAGKWESAMVRRQDGAGREQKITGYRPIRSE